MVHSAHAARHGRPTRGLVKGVSSAAEVFVRHIETGEHQAYHALLLIRLVVRSRRLILDGILKKCGNGCMLLGLAGYGLRGAEATALCEPSKLVIVSFHLFTGTAHPVFAAGLRAPT